MVRSQKKMMSRGLQRPFTSLACVDASRLELMPKSRSSKGPSYQASPMPRSRKKQTAQHTPQTLPHPHDGFPLIHRSTRSAPLSTPRGGSHSGRLDRVLLNDPRTSRRKLRSAQTKKAME